MFANMDLVCGISLEFEIVCRYICEFDLEPVLFHDFEHV
jgi:hypothetical protein